PYGVTLSELMADAHRVETLNDIRLVATVVTGIAFIVWFRRAYANLDGLGATRRYGIGWAIGSWVCPIACFWIPKRIADDLWAGSGVRGRHGSRDAGAPRRSGLILAWWASLIASAVIAFGTRSADDRTLSDALTTNTQYIV